MSKKGFKRLTFSLLALASLFAFTHRQESNLYEHTKIPPDAEKALVEKVIDGDTFILESGEKVRLIGIDTPEKAGPYTTEEAYGKEATAFAEALLEGKTVYLEKDTSETDRYGRLLRYAYLEDGTFVNLELLEEGLAEALEYPPDTRFADMFRAAEDKALDQKKGLWR